MLQMSGFVWKSFIRRFFLCTIFFHYYVWLLPYLLTAYATYKVLSGDGKTVAYLDSEEELVYGCFPKLTGITAYLLGV